MKLIFDHSRAGCSATAQSPRPLQNLASAESALDDLPQELLRKTAAALPEVSELQTVRHYTKLSQRNFSIDTHFYPLVPAP
ncbi:MAG: hypothetical protein JKX83_08635 [Pseudomonadales bacterium]|nr:hypothetical protein [Pseudomonadales bacterium]